MTAHWYVYRIGGGVPWYQHSSYASAETEAKRLVDTVGGEFEILEAKSVVKAAPRYIVENLVSHFTISSRDGDDSQIPF